MYINEPRRINGLLDLMVGHTVETRLPGAGSATLNVLKPLLNSIRDMGEWAIQTLESELSAHKNVAEIRGLGLMIGIEFYHPDGRPAGDIVQLIRKKCLEQNLLLVSCGSHGHVIRLMPPLTISKSELKEGLAVFISVCQQL